MVLITVGKSLQSGLLSDRSGVPYRIPRFHHHTTGPDTPRSKRVVVIQADALTEAGLATLLVVPLTSQQRRGAEALRVLIPARDRLLRECWAMAEQPRALDRNRIGEGPLTRLSAAEMATLEQALRAALGLAGG